MLLGYDYPLVKCEVHGDRKLGYAVCIHVSRGADARRHYAPTESELGFIVCARCEDDELSGDWTRLNRVACVLQLHCAECVAYHLGARLPACEVEFPEMAVQ